SSGLLRSGYWRASRAKAPPRATARIVPSSHEKAVTPPDSASEAGSRKKPEPIMLLATTNVASTGPIFLAVLVAVIVARSMRVKEDGATRAPSCGVAQALLSLLCRRP